MSCDPYPDNWGKTTIRFAEDNICGWVAQPANTWSNLAYIIFALVMVWEIQKFKILNRIMWGFPITSALIGLTSGFYHASATFIGQFFDFAAIYVFGAYLIYLALNRRNIRQKYLLTGLGVMIVILLLTLWFLPFLRIYIAFGMLFVLLYVEFTNKVKPATYRNLYIGLSVFALAYGIWLLDQRYIWDIDHVEHFINGHAIWHVLTAVSIYFGYKHYSQESLNNR